MATKKKETKKEKLFIDADEVIVGKEQPEFPEDLIQEGDNNGVHDDNGEDYEDEPGFWKKHGLKLKITAVVLAGLYVFDKLDKCIDINITITDCDTACAPGYIKNIESIDFENPEFVVTQTEGFDVTDEKQLDQAAQLLAKKYGLYSVEDWKNLIRWNYGFGSLTDSDAYDMIDATFNSKMATILGNFQYGKATDLTGYEFVSMADFYWISNPIAIEMFEYEINNFNEMLRLMASGEKSPELLSVTAEALESNYFYGGEDPFLPGKDYIYNSGGKESIYPFVASSYINVLGSTVYGPNNQTVTLSNGDKVTIQTISARYPEIREKLVDCVGPIVICDENGIPCKIIFSGTDEEIKEAQEQASWQRVIGK